MNEISYKGLTDAEALHALYHGTVPLGMGWFHNNDAFSVADAQRVIDSHKTRPDSLKTGVSFDYVAGRPIKVDFDTEAKLIRRVDLYDRDAGPDACARVISAALAGMSK